MILTNNQIKEIVDNYAKNKNISIEKYSLYNVANWYGWWLPQTCLWHEKPCDYTYEENVENIENYLKHMIYEYDWEEKYGYKGNYDGCRKMCRECKYSCNNYNNEILSECTNMFCKKLSDKYNLSIEIKEAGNICNKFESMFEKQPILDKKEYFDWLAHAWYVNFKGETIIQNELILIIINKIHYNIPYLTFIQGGIIKGSKVQCVRYHGGKYYIKSHRYEIQGNEPIKPILNNKINDNLTDK